MALLVRYKQGSLLPWQALYIPPEHDKESFVVKRFYSREAAQKFRRKNARMSFVAPSSSGKLLGLFIHFAIHHVTIAAGIAMTGVLLALFGVH